MSKITETDFLEWVRANAPEMEKNLTLGDVHQTTALGNEKPKKKKKTQTTTPVVGDRRPKDDNSDIMKERTRKTLARALEDLTFDEAGSSDKSFDWFIQQVLPGTLKRRDEEFERHAGYYIDGNGEYHEADPGLVKLEQALMDSYDDWAADRIEPPVVLKVGTRKVLLMRHGATHLNDNDTSVDRIRGWKDVPLSEEGKKEAAKLAKKVAKQPPDVILCSDLKRAHDTAKMVADACGLKAQPDKAFRPWDVGKFAGKASKEAVPILIQYAIEKPDETIPGGESFNDFYQRFMSGLADAMEKYPKGTIGIVSHHRNERAIEASIKAGWDGIDGKEFGKKGEGTAGFEYVELPPDKVREAGKTGVAKWVNAPSDYSEIWEEDNAINKPAFHITKIDREKQMVFGIWSVTTINGDPVVDKQDDIIPTEELEKAVYNFVLKSRVQGDMHKDMDVGRCVESMMFTKEKQLAINEYLKEMGSEGAGMDLGMEFWWGGFKVDDAQTWADIKSGKLPEFSIGGKGQRSDIVA